LAPLTFGSIGAHTYRLVALDDTLNKSEPATIVVTYNPYYDTMATACLTRKRAGTTPDGDSTPDYADPDADDDGMPDEWEHENQLDPYTPDADGDPDDDGTSNGLEYLYGSLPRDGTSVPSPSDVSVDPCTLSLTSSAPTAVVEVINAGDLPPAMDG